MSEGPEYGYDQQYWDELPDETKDGIRQAAAQEMGEVPMRISKVQDICPSAHQPYMGARERSMFDPGLPEDVMVRCVRPEHHEGLCKGLLVWLSADNGPQGYSLGVITWETL